MSFREKTECMPSNEGGCGEGARVGTQCPGRLRSTADEKLGALKGRRLIARRTYYIVETNGRTGRNSGEKGSI